jgi:hypothetical protein
VPAGPVRPPPGSPAAWEAVWRARRERFAARLASSGQTAEAAWVRAQAERLDAMRAQINRVVQSDSFQGLFRRLQAGWIFGILLLKQIGVLLLLWAAALLLARAAAAEREEEHPARGVWLAVYLGLFLAPVLLLAPYGSIPLALAGQAIGLALVGTVALARWIGRRQGRRAQGIGSDPREYGWQFGLVGLVALLPSTALLVLDCAAVRRGLGGTEVIFPFRELYGMIGTQSPSPIDLAVPALVLLPAALLPFGVLCAIAARELPLTTGLARGVRRAAPYAIVLLALLYLGSLAPTVAADRALERHVEQMVTDELGS